MVAQLIFLGAIALAFVLVFFLFRALAKINERAAAEHREHCTKLAVEAFEPSDALLRLRALREKQRRDDLWRDNRGTSARGLIGGAQGSSAGGAAGPSGSVLPQGAGPNSVDYSNPMVSLLRDDFDYTPERCGSSSFSDSSYSCDSSSSSDSGSSGGGE